MSLSSPPGTERDVRQMGCHRVAHSSGKSLPLTYPAAGAKDSKVMSSDFGSASLSGTDFACVCLVCYVRNVPYIRQSTALV